MEHEITVYLWLVPAPEGLAEREPGAFGIAGTLCKEPPEGPSVFLQNCSLTVKINGGAIAAKLPALTAKVREEEMLEAELFRGAKALLDTLDKALGKMEGK